MLNSHTEINGTFKRSALDRMSLQNFLKCLQNVFCDDKKYAFQCTLNTFN